MTQQHPVTPPPELVQQWINEADGGHDPRWQDYEQDIATRAAQWGADQELEACCEWLHARIGGIYPSDLRAARRPKPPSLKEQALDALAHIATGPNPTAFLDCQDTIRRALEQLPAHE
jgi:hypothetical protein